MPTNINQCPAKDLYLASSIAELDEMAARIDIKKIRNNRLENACQKFYTQLRSASDDQEQCYIIGKRYLAVMDHLIEVSRERSIIFDKYFHETRRIRGLVENLRINLNKRYVELAEQKKLAKNKVKSALETPVNKVVAGPSVLPGFEEPYISCHHLYQAITRNEDMLLIDIRPEEDFCKSHIPFGNTINIPPDVIAPGYSAHSLTPFLSLDVQSIWERRDTFAVLVLMDWNSTKENVNCKLDRLRSYITDWDLNRKYFQHPVYLNGGFSLFLETYPTQVTNCHVFLVRKNEEIDELLEIDSIEYQDLHHEPIEIKNKSFSVADVSDDKEECAFNIDPSIEECITSVDEYYNIRFDEDGIPDDVPASTHISDEQADVEYLNREISGRYISPFEGIQFSDSNLDLTRKNSEISLGGRHMLEAGTSTSTTKFSDDDRASTSSDVTLYTTPMSSPQMPVYHDENAKMRQLLDAVKKNPNLGVIFKPELPPKPKEYISNIGDTVRHNQPPPIFRETKPIDDENEGWCGLFNIRNTCYQNTALQCLKCIPAIRYIFTQTDYTKYITGVNPRLMHEFAHAMRALWRGTEENKKIFRSQKFYDKICVLNEIYKKGAHEDCLEFFLFILTYLTEDCQVEVDTTGVMTERQKAWIAQLQGQTSIFVDLFYHQLASKKICQNCRNQVTTYETDNTFMLAMPRRDRIHLNDLIDEYLDDNQFMDYKCTKCNKMEVKLRKDVVVSPEILVIVLKRYYQDENLATRKNNYPVDFELKTIFAKHTYKLFSIAEHRGTMTHGHYFAHGLLKEGDRYTPDTWVEFNDEKVARYYYNVKDNMDIKSTVCAFFYYKIKN